MLFTKEQLRNLEADGEETFKFVDNGKISAKEKQRILDLDNDFFEIYGKHIITNHHELKK